MRFQRPGSYSANSANGKFYSFKRGSQELPKRYVRDDGNISKQMRATLFQLCVAANEAEGFIYWAVDEAFCPRREMK